MTNLKLSVVIPAYNEEENIKKKAPDQVIDYLKKQDYSWELLFVDDGSKDKTADLLEKYSKREVSLGRVAETAKIPLVFRTKNHPFSLPKPIIQLPILKNHSTNAIKSRYLATFGISCTKLLKEI